MQRYIMLIVVLFYSCNFSTNKSETPEKNTDSLTKKDTLINSSLQTSKKNVLLEEHILFNGKLKRFFTMKEFEQVFGEPDSIKYLKDEAPCVSIFDTEGPEDKYLYKNSSRFETSGDRVAVEEFWFREGNFMTYKGVEINDSTTLEDIQRLFPNSIQENQELDKNDKEWMMMFMEDEEGISDGHIRLYFKNNKVEYILWWFPC